MSAPFKPAPRTRTSTSPAPGSGSGCSSTTSEPSLMVAARIARLILLTSALDAAPWRGDTGPVLRRALLAAGAALVLAAPAQADTTGPPLSTWVPDGEVKALAVSGQTAYIG